MIYTINLIYFILIIFYKQHISERPTTKSESEAVGQDGISNGKRAGTR